MLRASLKPRARGPGARTVRPAALPPPPGRAPTPTVANPAFFRGERDENDSVPPAALTQLDFHPLFSHPHPLSQPCASASASTSARAASRAATPAGSCSASSTASSPTARCPRTRPSAAATTPSTPSSRRRAPASTCPAASSSISSRTYKNTQAPRAHARLRKGKARTRGDEHTQIGAPAGWGARSQRARAQAAGRVSPFLLELP